MKIVIVETSAVSSKDLKDLIAEIIPKAVVQEIIDSSLLDEVVANHGVTPYIRHRMSTYFKFAEEMGADVILNQCSSVSEVAAWAQNFCSIPIVSIDKGMAVKAVNSGRKIGLVATVATTVKPSSSNIIRTAKEQGKEITLTPYLVDGAMDILIKKGDAETHNKMVIGAVEQAARENDVVVLAQGSMVVLLPLLAHIDKPVLSSPRIGIEYLKSVIDGLE
ncbi:aspartate/glutamate racemase family protein [Anaerolentibacter hominis]|uniref:aspartate/glutamate racemase family protein n=1 Tax=Anaerolentibacter hominis TaxID=3079009 RepID=UPI0031B8ADD2